MRGGESCEQPIRLGLSGVHISGEDCYVMAALPEDGELRLGEVRVPRGRRVRAGEGPNEPVAWVTDEPVENPGRTWLALSGMAAATGPQPVLQVTPDWIPGYRPEGRFLRTRCRRGP